VVPPEMVTWLNFWENAELIRSERVMAVNNLLIIS
jgi:hypothetical protein